MRIIGNSQPAMFDYIIYWRVSILRYLSSTLQPKNRRFQSAVSFMVLFLSGIYHRDKILKIRSTNIVCTHIPYLYSKEISFRFSMSRRCLPIFPAFFADGHNENSRPPASTRAPPRGPWAESARPRRYDSRPPREEVMDLTIGHGDLYGIWMDNDILIFVWYL